MPDIPYLGTFFLTVPYPSVAQARNISLRNCPGRFSSFRRRFGARCDDAHHCEQNGDIFEANFFAKVIEVYTRALELCTAWAT